MKQNENPEFYKKKKWWVVCLAIALGIIVITIFFLRPEKTDMSDKAVTKNLNLKDSISATHNDSLVKNDTEILVNGQGLAVVKTHCTSCHSAKLIVQNRATREGWLNMIRWMQQTQNLWDLGESEEIILNYLSTHYAPEEKGRRENLKDIEWYELKE